MFQNRKVIWKEGMFLLPQHFQQAERYYFNSVNHKITAVQPNFSGLTDIDIDNDSLSNGQFFLKRCSGILPDGTPFFMPEEVSLPVSRSFTNHFSHDRLVLDVYLALPLIGEGRENVAGEETGRHDLCRFISQVSEVGDEVNGEQKKEIELGKLNFTVLFEGELSDNYSVLQIARLKRSSTGRVDLQEDYIPPLLRISASRYLKNEIRGLLEILLAKCNNLSQGRKQGRGGMAEFPASEENAFRLLWTLNSFTPLLNYYYASSSVHPCDLFSTLVMFAGGLSTFSFDISPVNFPLYDHNNLSAVFKTLFKSVRSILDLGISAGCINVPVEQVSPSVYVCKIPDERVLSNSKLFLGIWAGIPEKELIVSSLQRIKMCSQEKLDLLISSAMPGLTLMHMPNPPEGLSRKDGFIYFSLDQQSHLWSAMKSSASVAFYFPNNYPDLKIEMLALEM